MKKLIILFLFVVGLLPIASATEYFIVKIGNNLTIYQAKDYGESNYWGRNVVIDKSEIVTPDDSYFKGLNIPEEEWKVFAQNHNGIYDSRLEKSEKEKESLRQDYNKLFGQKSIAEDNIKTLEIVIFIIFASLIFLIIKIFILKKRFKRYTNLINNEIH
jgi:hypothetical protein